MAGAGGQAEAGTQAKALLTAIDVMGKVKSVEDGATSMLAYLARKRKEGPITWAALRDDPSFWIECTKVAQAIAGAVAMGIETKEGAAATVKKVLETATPYLKAGEIGAKVAQDRRDPQPPDDAAAAEGGRGGPRSSASSSPRRSTCSATRRPRRTPPRREGREGGGRGARERPARPRRRRRGGAAARPRRDPLDFDIDVVEPAAAAAGAAAPAPARRARPAPRAQVGGDAGGAALVARRADRGHRRRVPRAAEPAARAGADLRDRAGAAEGRARRAAPGARGQREPGAAARGVRHARGQPGEVRARSPRSTASRSTSARPTSTRRTCSSRAPCPKIEDLKVKTISQRGPLHRRQRRRTWARSASSCPSRPPGPRG